MHDWLVKFLATEIELLSTNNFIFLTQFVLQTKLISLTFVYFLTIAVLQKRLISF